MSIMIWIVLGLLAGFITSKFVNKTGENIAKDVLLGVCGALVGGGIFNALGMAGATGLNFRSVAASVAGASLILIGYHGLQSPQVKWS